MHQSANAPWLAKRIGPVIRKLRIINKLSQSELAKRVGTSQVTISRLETGERGTTLENLALIATALKGKKLWQLIRAAEDHQQD